MTDTDQLIRRSITKGDYADDPQSGRAGLWNILIGPTDLFAAPGLPATWSWQRDAVLYMTRKMEDMWSSAVYKAKTKTVARNWEIDDSDDAERRTRRYQQMLLRYDGKRFVPGFSRTLDSFLQTDNGAFVEVVRATNARGSRILGLMHLDPFRCRRTSDPDVPVLYTDLKGHEHEVRDYQVLDFVDEPSLLATSYGTGQCAASRAFRTILKLAAVETYFREKVTGDRNLAIHIVNGISSDQLDDALVTSDAEKRRKGWVYYKGSVVIPAIKMDADLSVITIPLASIPDGFDVQEERKDAYLRYANALGVPVQDIQPLSGQGLGTGTQTVILAEEAEGVGLAAFLSDWTHALNECVLPETTTFSWTNPHDMRDQKAKAEVQQAQAQVIATLLGNPTAPGILTQAQALNLAADWGLIPREFLPADGDQTPAGDLSDDEKPVGLIVPAALPAPVAAPVAAPVPPAPLPLVKEAKADDLDDEAIKWAVEISDE
jgi:hypothetical protein